MMKYIGIYIKGKDCKGLYLFCDTESKHIESIEQAKELIHSDYFKIRLQVKVNGVRVRKVFIFKKGAKDIDIYNQRKRSFEKALEYVANKREVIRDMLKENGILKSVKA